MGAYRRKVYKKKSMDLFHEKGLEGNIKDEVDFFYKSEGEIDNTMIFEEHPILLDEPDIVKELKEEERLGKLQTFMVDNPEKKKQNSALSIVESLEIYEESERESKKEQINSYNGALKLAKKVLNKINEN
jgi:hypothetical protein